MESKPSEWSKNMQKSGKILTAIGMAWFASLALLFVGMMFFANRVAGVGIDLPISIATMKVVLPVLLFGWIPVLAVGIYRMKRLR
jgi:hypothetical protein